MDEDIFCRSRLLLGDAVMERLATLRVIVFGVGGVGSWCVESLVRSGLKHITIVDDDRVNPTNINRQLMATTGTVGELKVEAFKRHLLEINPEAVIDARCERFCEATADSFALEEYDCIVDAIDSLRDKALLIERATMTHAKFVSSMGAALKIDPTKVRVAEFRKVTGCPLARALRQRFKKSGQMPKRKFDCVYSDQLVRNAGAPSPNGSLMHITAIFGLTLTGLIIEWLRAAESNDQ